MEKGVILYLGIALSLLLLLPAASATKIIHPEVTFTSPNGQSGGDFGLSVAVSGDREVIGAPFESAGGFFGAGHAYIFDAPTGSLIATLTSPNPQASGFFGISVGINDTTVVIGAIGEAAFSGHAYIFSTAGSPIASLTSPNAQAGGEFGHSVAVSDTSVVVGASTENASGFPAAGHAYIFNPTGSILTLTSPNAQTDGEFGRSMAVSGGTLVIGAPLERPGGLFEAGQAYIFSTVGSPITNLASPNTQLQGFFGNSVGVNGTRIVVGAPGETAAGFTSAGKVYIFTSAGSSTATLASPNAQTGGEFGFAVAIIGTSAIVGAPFETATGFTVAGHAYIFNTEDSKMTTLTSPNAETSGQFGFSVGSAISHSDLGIVGARGETASGFSAAGHAYLFRLKS